MVPTIISLKQLCKQYGVSSPLGTTKQQMIDQLTELGVDVNTVPEVRKNKSLEKMKKANKNKVEQPVDVIVRMDRTNSTFTFSGYRFTKEQPYCLMKNETALILFEQYTGFRVASPQEVMEFYSE